MSRISAILTVLAALALSACASAIRSDVSHFHQLSNINQGATFTIVPKDPGKQGSLEFAQYAGLIRAQMVALGFTPVNAGNASDLIVQVDYAVSDGEQVTRDYYPYYPYGFGYGYGHYGFHHARFHHFGHFGHGFYPYGYGYGYGYGNYSYTVYTRSLEIDIVRPSAPGSREVVFEGRLSSVGRENSLPEVMPYLVQAMFTDFPGEQGKMRHVKIKTADASTY